MRHLTRFTIFLLLACVANAQQIPPTAPIIRGVFPHGGQRGTDVDVTIRGTNLQDASEIRFATPKLSAKVLSSAHNQVRVHVHLDGAAEPGRHDMRLIAPQGSTIGWFDVGTRPESFEKEPNNNIAHAQPLVFPALVNGIIDAGDYDYYQFTARAGETLTFDVLAQRDQSPLDPVLSILNDKGVELEYNDDYYWSKDSHIVRTFNEVGTYYLRIYGTGESGSPNADYRLIAGEMPHVDYVMPLGGQRGTTVDIRLSGVNLGNVEGAVLGDGVVAGEVVSRSDRSAVIRMRIPETTANGMYRLHVADATLPVSFVVSDLPQMITDAKSGVSKQVPIRVMLPVVASGVVDTPGGGHYYSFHIDQPQKVVLAVDSMSLNFDLDAMVVLYDGTGKRIAYQDDPTPTNSGKRPANLDPHLVVDLKPGRYTAFVRDNAFRGNPMFAYRFVMKVAEPDFIAGIVGSDQALFRGKDTTMTVRVRRVEGWNSPVEVWAENLPPGISLPAKTVVPPTVTHYKGTCGEDNLLDGTEVEIPVHIAGDAPGGLSQIRFVVAGEMDGRKVQHTVTADYQWRSAEKIWGPSETPQVYVTVNEAPKLLIDAPDRVAAPKGKEGIIKLVISRLDNGSAPLELSALNLPAGLTISTVTVQPGGTLAEMKFSGTVEKAVPITLQGSAAGIVLGKSHIVLLDPAMKAAGPKVIADEN